MNPSKLIASFYVISANSAEPNQTPQDAALDQGIHCLLTDYTFKILDLPTIFKFEMVLSK